MEKGCGHKPRNNIMAATGNWEKDMEWIISP